MKYAYDVYKFTTSGLDRIHTCVTFNYDLFKDYLAKLDHTINITNQLTNETYPPLTSRDCLIMWQDKLEKEAAWKPEVKDKMTPASVMAVQEFFEEVVANHSEGSVAEVAKKPDTNFATNYAPTGQATHYTDIVPGMQYQDMMQYMLVGKDPVSASLYTQMYRYLMRSGKKDKELQELKKARWYLQYQIMRLENGGNPIKSDDVTAKLALLD